jgi:hypothetical protein
MSALNNEPYIMISNDCSELITKSKALPPSTKKQSVLTRRGKRKCSNTGRHRAKYSQ